SSRNSHEDPFFPCQPRPPNGILDLCSTTLSSRKVSNSSSLARGGAMNEETLFQEALSRSPEERAAFLEQACSGRPDLRAAVEALLAAHDRPGHILDMPPPTADSGPGQ